MNEQSSSSPSPASGVEDSAEPDPGSQPKPSSLLTRLRDLARPRATNGTVREALEEIIEERADAEEPIGADEKLLLGNILALRGLAVGDVMVPLADIVAVPLATPRDQIIDIIASSGHSRLPVYRDSLDDAMGMVHIKDLLVWRGREEDFDLSKLLRRILFVAPSMPVLELLLEMRVTRSHLALVVDEYGGVDGLATIEDLVEEIVGEIEDEHDRQEEPRLVENADGTYTVDARLTLDALEAHLGRPVATDEDREDVDTLGGLVFALAGRVPIRGELIAQPLAATDESEESDGGAIEFEILDADPRRIRRVKVRCRPAAGGADADSGPE